MSDLAFNFQLQREIITFNVFELKYEFVSLEELHTYLIGTF